MRTISTNGAQLPEQAIVGNPMPRASDYANAFRTRKVDVDFDSKEEEEEEPNKKRNRKFSGSQCFAKISLDPSIE